MFNKKIALIQLPSPYLLVEKWVVPLHLYYLKAYLNKMGFKKVIVIDLGGTKDYKSEIPSDCDYYGISVYTPQYHLSREVSAYIKDNFVGTIIAGGPHITALSEESLRDSRIDIAVIGEGECTLFDIVSGVKLNEIPGIAYKDDSKIKINPPRTFHHNIDDFPFPDVSQMDISQYRGMFLSKNKYEMAIMSSRGCPYSCAFCFNKKAWRSKVRFNSSEYVINVLNKLYDCGINDFRFMDNNFDLNYPRLTKILKHLKSLKSKWKCSMRSENVTPKIISLMKESGLVEVSLGIESGSDKILKIINKGESVKEHIKAIETLKEHNIIVKAFIMSGLPGEDQTTVDETIKFIKESSVDLFTLFTFVPFPGTDIWEYPKRFNYFFDKNKNYDNYNILSKNKDNPSISKDEDKLSYYRKELFDACVEKNTVVHSFKIAEELSIERNSKKA